MTKIDRKKLKKALMELSKIAPKKGVPILSGCRVVKYPDDSGYDTISLTTTDLDLFLTAIIQSETPDILKYDGILPAKRLYDFVRQGKDKMVDLRFFPAVSIDNVEIDNSVFDRDSWPIDPIDAKKYERSVDEFLLIPALHDIFDYTLPTISTDETRPHMNCILIEPDAAISTDGHRMHVRQAINCGITDPLILPRKTATTLQRILPKSGTLHTTIYKAIDKKSLDRDEAVSWAQFTVVDSDITWILTTKANNADFPPYRQVMPKSHDLAIAVDRVELLETAKQAAQVASGSRLVVNGKVELITEHAEAKHRATLTHISEIVLPESKELFEIGINNNYLIDTLSCMLSDTVKIELQGPLDPIVITESGRYAVIMPMRI